MELISLMKLISLDISTILIYFLLCLGGSYKQVILSFLIIIIHEIGHIFFLKIFKVSIDKITIYPFGGLITTHKLINYPPLKELLISLGGIMNQILLIPIFKTLLSSSYINSYTYYLFMKLNLSILLFNLLPIIPLDGYLILSSILNIWIPYLKSNILSIMISLGSLIIFIIVSFNLKINSIFVISFLVYKIYIYLKDYKYYKNKFILERIIYDVPYHKIVYKSYYSPYYLGLNKYYYFNYQSEKKYLKDYYHDYI